MAQTPVPDEGTEAGHTFEITSRSRGSYGVVGEEGHTDASVFGPPLTIRVRAWDLPAALRKAAALPLSAWDGFGEARETVAEVEPACTCPERPCPRASVANGGQRPLAGW